MRRRVLSKHLLANGLINARYVLGLEKRDLTREEARCFFKLHGPFSGVDWCDNPTISPPSKYEHKAEYVSDGCGAIVRHDRSPDFLENVSSRCDGNDTHHRALATNAMPVGMRRFLAPKKRVKHDPVANCTAASASPPSGKASGEFTRPNGPFQVIVSIAHAAAWAMETMT